MANAYKNKVIYNNQTLIDISDSTAVASDVASGKYFYLATGEKVQGSATGGTAAISVVDTADSHGGTVRTITALDISDTTAVASDVASGKYFYTAAGVKTAGTGSGGGGYTSVYQDGNGYLVFDDEEVTPIVEQIVDHSYPQGAISTTATTMLAHTFRERTGITSFSAPEMTSMGGYQFYHCTALESVYFPKLSGISTSNAFDGCTALKGIVLPVLSYLHTTSPFNGCSNMEYVDIGIPGIAGLGSSNAFTNCAKLDTIVLRRTAGVTAISGTGIFNGTPFASGGTGGTLYVPSDLVSSYQSATNWSVILGYANNQIKAIEDSYYETYYADGTVIS